MLTKKAEYKNKDKFKEFMEKFPSQQMSKWHLEWSKTMKEKVKGIKREKTSEKQQLQKKKSWQDNFVQL